MKIVVAHATRKEGWSQCPHGTPCHTGRRSDRWMIPSLWRATPPVTSEPLVEVLGSSPISRLSPLPALTLNQGPFPRPALPGVISSTGLSATRHSPACPSRASSWRSRASTASGFPCCVQSPCTYMPSPSRSRLGRVQPRRNRWDSVARLCQPEVRLVPSDGGLPRYSGGSASALPFSRPAQRSLTLRPDYGLHACRVARGDPLHRRLQPFCYLRDCSDCYRLERPVAGWESHPLKIHAFPRRTE